MHEAGYDDLTIAQSRLLMGRDQDDNTDRMLRSGAGVRLKRQSTPGQIAAAVSGVLHNPQYTAALAASRRF